MIGTHMVFKISHRREHDSSHLAMPSAGKGKIDFVVKSAALNFLFSSGKVGGQGLSKVHGDIQLALASGTGKMMCEVGGVWR